ncbi:Acetoin utilization deacetylase AcuC [Nitrosomonas eutropha]|uniref:histone deacetylase family protein n=1 Tax=Nitrosomonas eutropha TaxID=916 RepID=UPI000890C5D7|nr:histone deacetylase family protein [Nitrosomonas eutropha]SCX28195.1 Acetoin utilization deacetylase AcuC [Nitrosomonas eutropha]SDX07292.1 Acetoin utilization deacetylase AcuC [Nitrosomonas eutropha]
MATAFVTHPIYLKHDMKHGHPECPERLLAIQEQLVATDTLPRLQQYEAPRATDDQLMRAHTESYVHEIKSAAPQQGLVCLDNDTAMNPFTLEAAYYAAGAVVLATDLVIDKQVKNAFCAVRPPGHHATRNQAMGFCFFNNVAIGAAHALAHHGLQRVAIVDFDVHHGNGTEDIFQDEPRVLFCSTFQHPFYPYCGTDSGGDHIINVPLAAHTNGQAFRVAVTHYWLPALEAFKPEIIFISAGFDAHREDTLAQLNLVEADYVWITRQIMAIAEKHAQNRIVSVLEGGYALGALGRSVTAHIRTLAE